MKLSRKWHRNYPLLDEDQPSREGGARHQPVTSRTPRDRTGEGDSKDEVESASFKRYRRFLDDDAIDAYSRNRKPELAKGKRVRLCQTAGTLTCVACVYYPLVCRWSSEARRRIARVSPGGSPWSIRRRLRNPLSSTDPLRFSGAHRARSRIPSWRVRLRARRMTKIEGVETKNKEAAFACLLVFV